MATMLLTMARASEQTGSVREAPQEPGSEKTVELSMARSSSASVSGSMAPLCR